MYFVVFYGSTADFAWVSDAAVIGYQGVEAFTKYAQEMVDKVSKKDKFIQLKFNLNSRLKQNLKKNNYHTEFFGIKLNFWFNFF
jgi:hypothetical protein